MANLPRRSVVKERPVLRSDNRRHCWECLRRNLVCDFSQPACRRCTKSGTACPGYAEAQPSRLRWLAPGKVSSRRDRRQKSAIRQEEDGEKATVWTITEPQNSRLSVAPPLIHMKTELRALVEAVEYFNSCIYFDLLPVQQLGMNPYVYHLSPWHLQVAASRPFHILLGFVCTTLSHRMHRCIDTCDYVSLSRSFYQHRGASLQSLRETLCTPENCDESTVIAGVLTLLLNDVHHGDLSDWRCHLECIQKFITSRGGIRAMARPRSLQPLLLCFVFTTVMGQTTTSASDLTFLNVNTDDLEAILDRYDDEIYALHLCPIRLFMEIMEINGLRRKALCADLTDAADIQYDVCDVLLRISNFSPEQWAKCKPSSIESWVLLGKTWQAAIALYCVLSMQSLSGASFLGDNVCDTFRTTNYHILCNLLAETLSTSTINRYMLWPLAVLGVGAAQGTSATRYFVARQMASLSFHIGSRIPLTVKAMLEKFWSSGEDRWDVCFDRSCLLTSQIAIDTSQM